MTQVILYGFLAVIPLIIGASLGIWLPVKEKIIGIISAFGAGALLAALTFGLMEEAFKLGGLDSATIGFIVGGILFVIGDFLIIKIGGRGHKDIYPNKPVDNTGWGIVLGAVLDGIPESMALGIGLVLNPKVGLLMLVAIFLSNLPEGVSSAFDLYRIKKSARQILLTWSGVAIFSFIFVILGYTIFAGISPDITAFFESLAAGAILAMLASTMMPEAYKESGLGASLATMAGFLIIFFLSKMGM